MKNLTIIFFLTISLHCGAQQCDQRIADSLELAQLEQSILSPFSLETTTTDCNTLRVVVHVVYDSGTPQLNSMISPEQVRSQIRFTNMVLRNDSLGYNAANYNVEWKTPYGEGNVVDNSREFTKGQANRMVSLSIAGGNIDYDLNLANKFYVDLNQDAVLQQPTSDRTQDVDILVENTGGKRLEFDSAYIVTGDTPTTTAGKFILLKIKCWKGTLPTWVEVVNQP